MSLSFRPLCVICRYCITCGADGGVVFVNIPERLVNFREILAWVFDVSIDIILTGMEGVFRKSAAVGLVPRSMF